MMISLKSIRSRYLQLSYRFSLEWRQTMGNTAATSDKDNALVTPASKMRPIQV